MVCEGVSVDAFNAYIGDGEGLSIDLRFLELSADGRILVTDWPTRVREATVQQFQQGVLAASGNFSEIALSGSETVHRGGKGG